jgi:hypothetical protein
MLSTEFIILILIFLVYISAWYVYMDKIIEASEVVISKFEKENYANEMSKKINTLCFTEGKINLEFKNKVEIKIENNILKIEGIERKINCDIENVNLKKNNFIIEKKEIITVS